MKKNYTEFEMNVVMLAMQDVVTASGFFGEEDGFENPNETSEVPAFVTNA